MRNSPGNLDKYIGRIHRADHLNLRDAYGSPIEITHPDGGKEYFRYLKNGDLLVHVDQDELVTRYIRDVLGRILSKKYDNIHGEVLAQETFTYSGFNLLSKTDKEGNTAYFSYDGAGRKIKENICGRITDFKYDPLGYLSTICRQNGESTLVIHYERDLAGRIIEERRTDLTGHILYKIAYDYDEDGNRKTITRYMGGKEAKEKFIYDTLGRLTEYQDPYLHTTKTAYDERHLNALGQFVLHTRTTDPLNITTLKTYDPFDHLVKKEILNPLTISCQEWIYDPHGNLTHQKDHLYENANFVSIQTIKFAYTPKNQLASMTRAYGTETPRTTTFTYTPGGKTATKTLPDETILYYSYHPLGFLSSLKSSDERIHHIFDYNKLGDLIYALDQKQNIAIKREVDPFGNVLREQFPSGLEVKKQYDNFDRLTNLEMLDQQNVIYHYDPLFLRSVSRTSKGEILYTHRYDAYDLDGNLVAESLIGNIGEVTHEIDLNGRKTAIQSPYFSQKCSYDPVGNLLYNFDGTETHYNYDSLSQLTSENACSYAYDSLYNRIKKNEKTIEVNQLNELRTHDSIRCSHDLNGNLILKETPTKTLRFAYDPLNRLIEADSENGKISFIYDPLGRRLSKTGQTAERYLYHGQNEIGAFNVQNEPINLRVLGLAKHKNSPSTIAIELDNRKFAPILDVQGNVRRLIDLNTKSTVSSYEFTAFGEVLNAQDRIFNPWKFASKRFDSELGLIYYGKRYYDPEFARWLTTDPAGITDSANLYQALFNNPFRYHDPEGEFAFLIPFIPILEIALPSLAFGLPSLTQLGMAAGIGLATFAGYEVAKWANQWDQRHYNSIRSEVLEEDELKTKTKDEKKKKPPYDGEKLGDDPTQCPGEGFKWKGKSSKPGSKEGSWHNENTKESLYPDLQHAPPKKPHWDYQSPEFPKGARINLDGTWESK